MISFALFAWPVLTLILARTLPWPNALVASLIGGYLLLPERGGFDLPLLPPLEKDTIPCMVLFLLALVLRPGQHQSFAAHAPAPAFTVLTGWLPRSATGLGLLAMMVAGAFLTALTNGDPLRFPDTSFSIPGLSLYDGASTIVRSLAVILPILLGRKYLADAKAHRVLLIGLVVAGLGYSLLAVVEARLSPQMNRWVYGFFPHSWHQHVRDGGFRPLVFLNHGLLLAIFFAMTVVAAFGLSRADPANRMRWLLAGGWLMLTLILCNSLGAAVIAVAILPIVLLLTIRLQLLIAGLIAASVLFYPLLRSEGLVPMNQIVALASSYDVRRGGSLNVRVQNEDALLARASERPLFGWGPYGRNRIYDDAGRDQSIVDGAWIVVIGQGGWLGYLSVFGLLCLPLILLAMRRGRYDVDQATAALCLILAANLIDMIPNSGRSPITWLIVGALLGRLELGRVAAPVAQSPVAGAPEDPVPGQKPAISYTRQSVVHQRARAGWKS